MLAGLAELAAGLQAVELGVVVEGFALLGPGGGDVHRLMLRGQA